MTQNVAGPDIFFSCRGVKGWGQRGWSGVPASARLPGLGDLSKPTAPAFFFVVKHRSRRRRIRRRMSLLLRHQSLLLQLLFQSEFRRYWSPFVWPPFNIHLFNRFSIDKVAIDLGDVYCWFKGRRVPLKKRHLNIYDVTPKVMPFRYHPYMNKELKIHHKPHHHLFSKSLLHTAVCLFILLLLCNLDKDSFESTLFTLRLETRQFRIS